MTDRVKGFTVTLDDDYRIDDVEKIMEAIRIFKGVGSVEPNITTSSDWVNRERVKNEFKGKLFKFIESEII